MRVNLPANLEPAKKSHIHHLLIDTALLPESLNLENEAESRENQGGAIASSGRNTNDEIPEPKSVNTESRATTSGESSLREASSRAIGHAEAWRILTKSLYVRPKTCALRHGENPSRRNIYL